MSPSSLPPTFTQAFQKTAVQRPDQVALRTPGGGVSITWRQYADRVRAIATGLASLGVKPGDTVSIMMTNRPEFHLVDTAVLHAGGTPFSVYNTLAPDQIAHLFRNAANRVVVCEAQFLPQIRTAAQGTAIEHIVVIDEAPSDTIALADLETREAPGFDFEATWRAVKPEDVLTIIYTSGTTGPSKGVELTHANLIAELESLMGLMPVTHDDRLVSYLPDAHIANRWGAHYNSLAHGLQITTVSDAKQMISALPEVRPTIFGAVPQVWYKVKSAIEAQVAAEPSTPKRNLAKWALDVGTATAWLRSEHKPIPRRIKVQHALADRLVLSKVRSKLGLDEVRAAVSGAAAISPDALAFVLGLGLPVAELWGMSETSCVVTINPVDDIRIGTVGKVVPGSEIRIAEDGELLVRGPLVMKGYRNEPEMTAEAIDSDGWLHTGDIATIDSDGYVRIVDRKKELIINAAGKNMSPQNIEGSIKVASPLIGSAVAIGDDRPYVVALLTLDPDAAALWARANGKSDVSAAALAEDPDLHALLDQAIKQANDRLSRVEQIKKFTVLPTVWEPGGTEITPTMKLRRRPIAEKYSAEIEALYS
jgi:long-subunit acyl-CoA synthetase (AMP-forming)